MVQEAGPLEDREAGLTDSGGPDGPDATQASVDVCVILQDASGLVECRDYLGVIEWYLVGDPLVIGIRACGTQHCVLKPVRGRPAGGTA